MLWDVVVVSCYLGFIALGMRGGPPETPQTADLPQNDQPPVASGLPMPRNPFAVRRYVGRGLQDLDDFLIRAQGRPPSDSDDSRPSEQ